MTVICQACQALNRDKAMFCRGCAAKLPAFAATGLSALETLAPARPRHTAAAVAPPRSGLMPVPGARGWFFAVALLSSVLIGLLVWTALIPARSGAVVPAKAAASAALPASAAATAIAPSARPAPSMPASSNPTPSPTVVPFESALAPGEMSVDKAPTLTASPPARPANPARIATTASKPPAAAGRPDPRVGCEHLFFAFAARCEANHCAEPAYARHPRCDVVREQRQRDEARRNLTSGY